MDMNLSLQHPTLRHAKLLGIFKNMDFITALFGNSFPKFLIVRRRKPCAPLRYITLVRIGDSVKISIKYTKSPREANYIGTTLNTVVKRGKISWNVQVLEN